MQKKIQNNKIIIDNLLPDHEAKVIIDRYYGEHFPWYFKNYVVDESQVVEESKKHQYQFTHHILREDGNIVTEQDNWQMLFPIFNRIHPRLGSHQSAGPARCPVPGPRLKVTT